MQLMIFVNLLFLFSLICGEKSDDHEDSNDLPPENTTSKLSSEILLSSMKCTESGRSYGAGIRTRMGSATLKFIRLKLY